LREVPGVRLVEGDGDFHGRGFHGIICRGR
jgi:hypothetical protein